MLREIYRANPFGWLVVGLSFLVLAFIFSARSSLGLMMPFWEQDLGWSRSFVSTGIGVVLVVMAISSPLAGNLLDRFGPRMVFTGGLVLVGVGFVLASLMTAQWQFIVTVCLMAGLGFGSTALPQVSATIAQLFERHRGLATGFAATGATGGQLILLPLLAVLATALGWRSTILLFGVTILAVAAAVWIVYGRGVKAPPRPGAEPGPDGADTLRAKLRYIAHNRTFWLLISGFFICGFTTTGVVEMHLIPYAASCGYPPVEGATAFGVQSAFNMAGVIGFGLLADRMSRPLLLGGIYFIRALSFVILIFVTDDVTFLYVFAAMFGITNYGTMPVVASIVASHIGVRIMGLTLGIMFAAHSIGGAAGALAAGYLYDMLATYLWTWIAAFALAALAAIFSWMIMERPAPEPAGAVPQPA
ncbi:MAG: MFS transporter [Alphaproteobacteria bacterium]|nr:MFS transporter [Alphaproteobacteria bacterium]